MVDLQQVEKATKALVKRIAREGNLEELTPRLVRKNVEEELSLERGTLDAAEYKSAVKTAIAAAVEEAEAGDLSEDEKKKKAPAKPRKRKSDGDSKQVKQKPPPKPRARKTKDDGKGIRSASLVPSSDEEENVPTTKPKSKAEASHKNGVDEDGAFMDQSEEPPQKRQRKATGSDEDEQMRDETKDRQSSPSTLVPETEKSEGPGPSAKETEETKSESEMSILVDDAQKPPRKSSKIQDPSSKPTKGKAEPRKRKSKEPQELSKAEQTIKRLKSLVVACGVRKVWAKELKDLDTSSSQIERIKKILIDLGMPAKGRMSLEQAKAIKEKRELAKELEDVQNFEKAIVSGPSASSRSRSGKQRAEVSEAESEEELADLPKRQRNAAHKSIMAFLDDQSD